MRWLSWERCALFAFGCLSALVLRSVPINGDGAEYLLSAHAIGAGQPRKLMRHAGRLAPTPGYCPAGQGLDGANVHAMPLGWEYVHAPFSCKVISADRH